LASQERKEGESMNEDDAARMAKMIGNDNGKKFIQSVLASSEGQELLRLLSKDPNRLEGLRQSIMKNDTQSVKAGLEKIMADTKGEQALRSLYEKLKE
jgi:hypothetical protein